MKTSTNPDQIDHRRFLESSPLVPWEADARTWHFTYVGPQAVDLLGFPVEDWYEQSFWIGRIHPDDRSQAISTCETLSAEGGDYDFEYRMLRSDGSVIWIRDVVAVEMGDTGPTKLKGFLIDITQRKALAESLEKSQEELKRVLQAVPDALLRVDVDGTIIGCNKYSVSLFGWSEEELIGSPIERLIPARLAQSHSVDRKAFTEDAQRRDMGMGRELLALTHDGSEISVEVSLSPIEGQQAIEVLATVRDVTYRKQIESELRERERQLRLMANALPALVGVVDENQRYRFVNDQYAKWVGLDLDRILNRPVRDVLGEQLYARVRPGIEAALSGEAVHREMEFPAPDGSMRTVELSRFPQYNVEGRVSGYVVVVFDISARLEAQAKDRLHREELAHVLRVATLGELASSFAHELNQPLAAIVTNAQAARRFLGATPPDLEEVDGALGNIVGDAKRAAEVIRRLGVLLKRGEPSEEFFDIEELISQTVDMLRSDAIARKVSVTVDCARDVPQMFGDRVQLQQVVLNLIVNAFDAIYEAERQEGGLAITISQSAGKMEISFSDDGSGLPDVEEDLFAPFVSTKPDGLGMGLSISRSIVEAHGGRLLAENNSNGGACLRVLLPALAREEL